jgi:hypothetical protein
MNVGRWSAARMSVIRPAVAREEPAMHLASGGAPRPALAISVRGLIFRPFL